MTIGGIGSSLYNYYGKQANIAKPLDGFTLTNMQSSNKKGYEVLQSISNTTENDIETKIIDLSSIEEYAKTRDLSLMNRINSKDIAPYSTLADENGAINYNGVTFYCDYKNNRLCLGDVSNPRNCINIPLSAGGSLVVNRNSIGELSKAIGMFSPEDINRIMRAIAQDNRVLEMEHEIDDAINSIGDSADVSILDNAETSNITDEMLQALFVDQDKQELD